MLLIPDGSLGFTLLCKHQWGLEEGQGWISRTEEDERPDASGIVFYHRATDPREQQEGVCSQSPPLKTRPLEGEHLLIIMKLIFSNILSINPGFILNLNLFYQTDNSDVHMMLQQQIFYSLNPENVITHYKNTFITQQQEHQAGSGVEKSEEPADKKSITINNRNISARCSKLGKGACAFWDVKSKTY